MTSTFLLPSLELAPGVRAGDAPADWLPLANCDVIVVVGLTGVGKSTTLARMEEQGAHFFNLPNRRALTDSLIIAAMQAADGDEPTPVADRSARFEYTRRFREHYPGGMAQAITLMRLAPEIASQPLLFDGLRGENEISYALETLPRARFVMLTAPDIVRVLRLVGRADAFDSIAGASPTQAVNLGDLLLDEVGTHFDETEANRLRLLISTGALSADEVRAKVKIVSEERRNYDPAATQALLEEQPPERALVVDTSQADSSAVASRILAWAQSY